MAEIKSGASSDLLTIDPASKAARASMYDGLGNPMFFGESEQPAAPRGLLSMGLNDEQILPLRVDRFGSVAQASHTPLLNEHFEGITINPHRWAIIATTMTAAQSPVSGITFNSGNSVAVNVGYLLRSVRSFARSLRQPLHAKFRARLAHVNNAVFELGFGDVGTFNGANTTGAYWQVTSAGALVPVLTFNGVDITGTDVRPLVNNASFYTFDIFMDDDEATFIIQETGTGLIINTQTIKLPIASPSLLSTTQIGFFARAFNTGIAPASAAVMILSSAYVAQLDGLINAPVSDIQALQWRGAEANPLTGVQLAQWGNSAAPASAALSNTVPGYTALGGLFQFAAPAGAVTDFTLFGFQAPVPATLVITGVSIDTWNTGAASATTPTLLNWALAANATTSSLASATTSRLTLGAQSIPVGAAVGAMADRSIQRQFDTPIVVGPGRFLHLVLRVPVGTATASQIIAGMVGFNGYFI